MTTPGPSGVVQAIRGRDGLQFGGSASLEVSLGRAAAVLERQEKRRLELAQAIHTVPVKGSALTAVSSGVLDFPDTLGPHDGYWWDLKNLKAWGWTAGTVTVYLNDGSGNGEIINQFNTPGSQTWGKAQQPLAPRDRLVVVAAGITGNVYIGGSAVEVLAPWWPEYVL